MARKFGYRAPMTEPREITARIDSECMKCHQPIHEGTRIMWQRGLGTWHVDCAASDTRPADVEPEEVEEESGETTAIDTLIANHVRKALGGFKPSQAMTRDDAHAMLKGAIDDLAKLMDEQIKARVAPVSVTVKVEQKGQKTKAIEGAHYMLPRLLKVAASGQAIALYGPAGTGKTTLAKQLAEALGRRSLTDTLDPSTFRSSILGFVNANGKPVYTKFLRCYEDGAIYIADELDCAPGNVHVLFNTALANGSAPAGWEDDLPRSPKFGFIGCMNTPGRPTPEHPERKNMALSLKDRLYFIFVPQDESIENRKAGLPPVPPPERKERTCTPAEWVTWVKAIRVWSAQYAAATIKPFTGQRASLTGVDMLAIGETPEEVADGLVFKGADADLKAKALAACPLP